MNIIFNRPLIHITPEEEEAIRIVAEMFDFIDNKVTECEPAKIYIGNDLCNFFFDNDYFECEVEGEE